MTVGELIAMLQELDAEAAVHVRDFHGFFEPLDHLDVGERWVGLDAY